MVKYSTLKIYVSLITLPFLSVIVTYKCLVTDALCLGNVSKEKCVLRSPLVGVACGILYRSALTFSKIDKQQSSITLLHCHQRVLVHWLLLCQTDKSHGNSSTLSDRLWNI
jgi:complex I assembly factor TMEM126B